MFGRSWQLMRESWAVLRQDTELLWFPILSGIVSLFVVATFAVPIILVEVTGSETFLGSTLSYGIGFAYYLASYFVVIFFSSALVGAAKIRLEGGNPTVADGFRVARAQVGRIFVWSLVSATVGVILRAISERSELLGQIIVALVGAVWSVLTMFVVPLLVIEELGVKDAIRESGALFKKTWGENVIGQLSLGLIFFLFSLLGVLPILGAILAQSLPMLIGMIILALIYWLFLSIVASSLGGIFLTALYLYARTGKVPSGFSPELIEQAFKAKQPKLAAAAPTV